MRLRIAIVTFAVGGATLGLATVFADRMAGKANPRGHAGGPSGQRLGANLPAREPPLSVDWVRAPTLRELMKSAHAVVRARVVAVNEAPAISAKDARAPAGTPDIPRQRITLATEKQLWGEPVGESFDLVRVLPPSGVVAREDAAYRSGERYLLFLVTADMPGSWQPQNGYQLFSRDGRLLVRSDGRFDGPLPDGPARELNIGADAEALIRSSAP